MKNPAQKEYWCNRRIWSAYLRGGLNSQIFDWYVEQWIARWRAYRLAITD